MKHSSQLAADWELFCYIEDYQPQRYAEKYTIHNPNIKFTHVTVVHCSTLLPFYSRIANFIANYNKHLSTRYFSIIS